MVQPELPSRPDPPLYFYVVELGNVILCRLPCNLKLKVIHDAYIVLIPVDEYEGKRVIADACVVHFMGKRCE